MNKILCFFILSLLFSTSLSHGQSIKELYLDLPEGRYRPDFSRESKLKFLDETPIGEWGEIVSEEGETHQWKPLILDISNGYMRLDTRGNLTDICYWQKGDGSKLVAICTTTSESYEDSEIKFYNYLAGEWTLLKTDSIFPRPDYVDLLDKRATLEANQGKAIPTERGMLSCATPILLPQKGKNIIVRFELVDTHEDYRDYKLILNKKTTRVKNHSEYTYLWNEGVFLKE